MSLDAALIIPHLSKQLNLIGHPELPYTLEKASRKNQKNRKGQEDYKIVFDTKLMITSLTNVCFELVKQIKTLGIDDNNDLDKLHFENVKLEKKLKSSNLELKKQSDEITSLKLANQLLQEKLDELEKKINEYKTTKQSLVQKNQTNEGILKHALKKNETEIFNLHKAVWKQFNMADQNYFPENFKLVQLNQPDFSKLWSTVEYSEQKTKESVLKKAVCVLQSNNTCLMEENFSLKTTLLTALNEIHETIKEFGDKLHLSESILPSIKISNLFVDITEFDCKIYIEVVNKHLSLVKKFNELFNEASFTVDDDIFICWSRMMDEIKVWFR